MIINSLKLNPKVINSLKQVPYLLTIVRKYRTFRSSSREERVKIIVNKFTDFMSPAKNRHTIILGHKVPTLFEWSRKYISVEKSIDGDISTNKQKNLQKPTIVQEPLVSILISLYKSELYLEKFLQNIEEQSALTYAEPCFILVEPSKFELDLVQKFCRDFPNARMSISQDRITIYEAWNQGINMTNAPYITNMNVDDSRRFDSIQIQLETFNHHPWVDVVYQDFFFTLEAHPKWELIRKMDFKTNLPPVTLVDLVLFGINSPHNAPMWRRQLHSELGLFNNTLKSAGDYEFWIKCAAAGKKFIKSKDCHVAYYVNPDGMSTSSISPSPTEEIELQNEWKSQYSKKLEKLNFHVNLSVPQSNAEQQLLQLFFESTESVDSVET